MLEIHGYKDKEMKNKASLLLFQPVFVFKILLTCIFKLETLKYHLFLECLRILWYNRRLKFMIIIVNNFEYMYF